MLALCRPPTSAELLRAVALARGWVVGNGLPDEARAGRLLLKDYTAGKLIYCEQPPNTQAEVQADAPYTGHDHHDGSQGSSYDPSEGGTCTHFTVYWQHRLFSHFMTFGARQVHLANACQPQLLLCYSQAR